MLVPASGDTAITYPGSVKDGHPLSSASLYSFCTVTVSPRSSSVCCASTPVWPETSGTGDFLLTFADIIFQSCILSQLWFLPEYPEKKFVPFPAWSSLLPSSACQVFLLPEEQKPLPSVLPTRSGTVNHSVFVCCSLLSCSVLSVCVSAPSLPMMPAALPITKIAPTRTTAPASKCNDSYC